MSAGILAAPGTKYGPCKRPCAHIDCAETRRIAAAPCRRCGEPIGYDTLYFSEQGGTVFIHLDCAWDEDHSKQPEGVAS